MAYVTYTDVGYFLGTTFTSGSTPSSTTVTSWIEESSDFIDQLLGFSYSSSSSQDLMVSVDNTSNIIWLADEYRPIISVTDLYRNDGSDWSPSWTILTEGTDFLITDIQLGKIKFQRPIIGPKTYAIKISTLTHGYSSVPSFIEELCTKMVSKKVIQAAIANTSYTSNERISVGPISISNESSFSVAYVKQLNDDIDRMIKELNGVISYTY